MLMTGYCILHDVVLADMNMCPYTKAGQVLESLLNVLPGAFSLTAFGQCQEDGINTERTSKKYDNPGLCQDWVEEIYLAFVLKVRRP